MILLSGATGNVGKHLVELLLAKGVKFRVLVRDSNKLAHLGDRVEIAVGDLDKPETLVAVMAGIDRLYLVTPETQQVIDLLEAARRAGVRHVVKQSTIEANRSLGPGRWHREQEEMIKASGLDWTFLRPTMMMVNVIEWWGATVRSRNAVYFPGGKGRVPPVDPRDVAAVACQVLTSPGHVGQTYELTGPEALTIGEMVSILGTVLGKRIRYVNVPASLAAIWMRRFGLPEYVVKGLIETIGALRRSEYAYITDTVEHISGGKPRSFEAWCHDHVAAFQ